MSQSLREGQGTGDHRGEEAHGIELDPLAGIALSELAVDAALRLALAQGVELLVDRLHVDGRVHDGDKMAQGRDGVHPPVTESAAAEAAGLRRGRPRRVSVSEDPERADRSEEDVAHLPERGPLPAEKTGPVRVVGGGRGREVY